jgi:hypothetical protein
MAIDFPASPTTGQTFTSGTVTYTWDGVKWTAVAAGGGATDKIEEGNTSAEVIDTGSDGTFVVTTEGTERARIDNSGRLLIGTSSSRSAGYSASLPGRIQSETTGYVGYTNIQNSNDAFGSAIVLGKSRGATVGSTTVVQNNDEVGTLTFAAADGTDLRSSCAYIGAFIDGTPGANDVPGRLVFSTTADGASTPTARLTLYQNGSAGFLNTKDVYPGTDNFTPLGVNGARWSAVWAANGTIQTSDERAKTDITDAQLGSDFIKALRPVSYKWIEGGKRDTGERDEDNNYIYESVPGERTHWGFVAQEVKQAVDAAGVDFGGWVLTDKDDPDSQQALRYDQFIAPLTKALQEALQKIEVLEAKVNALEGN